MNPTFPEDTSTAGLEMSLPTETGALLIVGGRRAVPAPQFRILERHFAVRFAADSSAALRALAEAAPELVLCDADGLGPRWREICVSLKAHPAARQTPLIVRSSSLAPHGESAYLADDGVDWLPGAVEPETLLACVRSRLTWWRHLCALRQQRDELQAACHLLRRRERQRAEWTDMIVHDLRSPLLTVSLFLDLLSPQTVGQEDFPR